MASRPDYVLACDPGFDELVISTFSTGRFRVADTNPRDRIPAAMRAYLGTTRIPTPAKETVTERIERIAPAVASLVRRYHVPDSPCLFVCEVPATFVAFGKRPGAHLALLALSIGTAIGVAKSSGAIVEELQPDRAPPGWPKDVKHFRKTMVHGACRTLGLKLERSQDVIDSQWLGVRALVRMRTAGRITAAESTETGRG